MLKLLIKNDLPRYFHTSALLMVLLSTLGCSPGRKQTEKGVGADEGDAALRLFSGFGRAEIEQLQAQPGYSLTFPEDHGSHPDYAVEWWYLTANLSDQQGKHYALQWTLFRFRGDNPSSPWANEQQFMAHASLHSADNSWFEERFARGGVGNGGVSSEPFKAQLDNWSWSSASAALFPSTLEFSIQQEVHIELSLSTRGDFVLHGEQGYSQKLRNSAQASYYYSQPHIDIMGSLVIADEVIALSGQAWFDHEWSSQYLDPKTQGWDWFSIHLNNGDKLMLFNMRHQVQADFWSGTLIRSGGKTHHLEEKDIQALVLKQEKVAGRLLPLQWSIRLPTYGLDIKVKAMKKEQWNEGMFSYYEGATFITGSHSGKGFIELTGY